MNNCNYNCTQQLSRKLAFLWRIDQYIEDAEEAGHPMCADMWRTIKADEEKHVGLLRSAIEGLSKDGKFE